MKRAFQKIRYGLIALGVTAFAHAGEVEMDITPRVLRLGESAICRIVVRDAANAPAPRLPPLNGFEVAAAGTEQNIQLVNGRQSISFAYRFQLTPLAAGDYLIGPFRYQLDGKIVDLPAVQIQVLPMETAGAGNQAQSIREVLFATLTASRPQVYAQEVFDLTIQLYSQPGINLDRNISLLDFDTTGLSLSGFEELASGREAVNGRVYDVRRFRARATALATGTFTLRPRLRVNLIIPRSRERMRDPFFGDSFFDNFFGRVETRAHTVDTEPLVLQVLDLPAEGRPSNFSGAVGRYAFEVSASPLQLRVGEPITLRYRIQGLGNIDTVRAPELALPDAFRAFDAQLVEQNANTGLKVFEQVVIPRSADVKELPAISFSYFDPEVGKYVTIARGPYPLELAAGDGGNAPLLQGAPARAATEPKTLGDDLVYLKSAPSRWPRATSSKGANPVAVHALPALALLLAAVYARHRDRLQKDPAKAARLRAPRSARAALARARAYRDQPVEAASALADALQRYFGPLLGIAPGQLDAESVCARLCAGGMDSASLDELRALFNFCERMRYAGPAAAISESDRAELQRHLERAPDLFSACRRYAR